MKKEFVPYELAVKLKALGFDEKCMAHYWEGLFYYQTTHTHPSTMPNSIESCSVPLYQQAFRWFREKYHLHYPMSVREGIWYFEAWSLKGYKTYEEAELACLQKLIEIVEQIKN